MHTIGRLREGTSGGTGGVAWAARCVHVVVRTVWEGAARLGWLRHACECRLYAVRCMPLCVPKPLCPK